MRIWPHTRLDSRLPHAHHHFWAPAHPSWCAPKQCHKHQSELLLVPHFVCNGECQVQPVVFSKDTLPLCTADASKVGNPCERQQRPSSTLAKAKAAQTCQCTSEQLIKQLINIQRTNREKWISEQRVLGGPSIEINGQAQKSRRKRN